jgi:ATP-dependent Lhr-like helicase
MGPALSEEARAEKLARVLLARYGVVTREVFEPEELPVEWAQLYSQFQLMELRGQVRRGYFVAGLAGVQFALPEAVEKLRAASAMTDDSLIILNATDPANLFGGELSNLSLRFARVPSTWLVLWRGQPVLVAEDSGERITTMSNVDTRVIQRALELFITRSHAPRHVMTTQWNGAKVWGSEGQPLLEALGFYRAPNGMEWWANP